MVIAAKVAMPYMLVPDSISTLQMHTWSVMYLYWSWRSDNDVDTFCIIYINSITGVYICFDLLSTHKLLSILLRPLPFSIKLPYPISTIEHTN